MGFGFSSLEAARPIASRVLAKCMPGMRREFARAVAEGLAPDDAAILVVLEELPSYSADLTQAFIAVDRRAAIVAQMQQADADGCGAWPATYLGAVRQRVPQPWPPGHLPCLIVAPPMFCVLGLAYGPLGSAAPEPEPPRRSGPTVLS